MKSFNSPLFFIWPWIANFVASCNRSFVDAVFPVQKMALYVGASRMVTNLILFWPAQTILQFDQDKVICLYIVFQKRAKSMSLFHLFIGGSLKAIHDKWESNKKKLSGKCSSVMQPRECFKKRKWKMRSFGHICIKRTILLHGLWQKRWVELQKLLHTYSRTLKVYCIVFDLRFPNSKAKSRLSWYISDFDVSSSWKSSNLV